MPRQFATILAGALAVAGTAPARAAPRNAHQSLCPKRRSDREFSVDQVAGLHAFVMRLVPETADAADIAQQALLLACSDHGANDIANVDAWLRCIARHLVIDHFRAGNRYNSVELRDALADSEPDLRTRADHALAVQESRERLDRLLDDATGQLCLLHQIAVLLADGYGHCDKYAAEALQMSLPCYKLVLHRARSAVRRERSGPSHPAGWLGVTCRLSRAEMLALRADLLEGLMT